MLWNGTAVTRVVQSPWANVQISPGNLLQGSLIRGKQLEGGSAYRAATLLMANEQCQPEKPTTTCGGVPWVALSAATGVLGL